MKWRGLFVLSVLLCAAVSSVLPASAMVFVSEGATVAGGNGSGSADDQLNRPRGVMVDNDGNVYVVDTGNHRVQMWAPDATAGVTVAGGNGSGGADNQLDNPRAVDVDGAGNVYVADTYNHRIQMWAPGSTTGVTVAGGNGRGSSASQFDAPSSFELDSTGNIYVADTFNHRVQLWAPGATAGVTVAGGNGSGSADDQLRRPRGVIVDGDGNVFVADTSNHRVQLWAPDATAGVTVAGGNGSGLAADQLNNPWAIDLDSDGNLFVADAFNHRVQLWAPGATAGVTVAGGNGSGSAAVELNTPYGLDVVDGNAFVADTNNSRVQLWAGANSAPTITSPAAVTVAENQIAALDVDAADDAAGLMFSLSGGDAELFSMDNASGVVSFALIPDFEAPSDLDGNNVYEFTVTVTDAGGLTDSQDVSVTVTDVEENGAPSIVSPADVSVLENQTSAIDVDATDDDVESLVFSFSGGDDAELFTIDAVTGVVSFAEAPDFEAPADTDADNVYAVQVTVTDAGELTASQNISITVTDVVENSGPTIVSPATVSVPENQLVALDVEAVDDVDSEGSGLVFAIDGGPDASRVEIDEFGVVTFVDVPDFEAPGDSNFNNLYLFQVTVTDSSDFVTSQIIRVTVTDVIENNNPAIVSPDEVSVPENQLSAIDVDAEDTDLERLVYSISGGDDVELFRINPDTGVVTFAASPDFEAPADLDADNVYAIEVTVADPGGLTSSQSIAVTVTDVAENVAPVVNVGDDLAVELPNGLAVSGSVTDDGLPEPAALTLAWTTTSGPGSAVFADATAADSAVTFPAAGSYVLRLTADDGELTSFDELTVEVAAVPGGPFSTNVRVSARGGSLLVNGDNDSNRIDLCQTAPGVIVTTIHGGPNPIVETSVGVTRDVRINLLGGDDTVALNPPSCGDSILEIGRDLLLALGTGDDTVTGANVNIADDLSLLGSSGDEIVNLAGVVVADRMTVNTAAGASALDFDSVVFGKAVLRGGSAADVWRFTDSDLGSVSALVTFNGDDEIQAIRTIASGRLTISTSNGADTVVWDDNTGDGGRGGDYTLNGVFGAQDDTVTIGDALIAGDRLNGGSGLGDTLTASGPGTILAFENLG